LRRKKK
jgi:hypothetical protein